jgi:hypothetical protein
MSMYNIYIYVYRYICIYIHIHTVYIYVYIYILLFLPKLPECILVLRLFVLVCLEKNGMGEFFKTHFLVFAVFNEHLNFAGLDFSRYSH